MNPARFDELVAKVALAIDRDAVEPSISARVLARAVVSLVEDRSGPECVYLALDLSELAQKYPRKDPS